MADHGNDSNYGRVRTIHDSIPDEFSRFRPVSCRCPSIPAGFMPLPIDSGWILIHNTDGFHGTTTWMDGMDGMDGIDPVDGDITDGEVLQVRLLLDPVADGFQALIAEELILAQLLAGHFLDVGRKGTHVIRRHGSADLNSGNVRRGWRVCVCVWGGGGWNPGEIQTTKVEK